MNNTRNLEIAKQGDPKAIAQVISEALGTTAVNVKARNNNGCLETILRAKDLLPKEELASEICNTISNLQPSNVSQLLITFYCGGETAPRWRCGFQVDPHGSITALDSSSQKNNPIPTYSSHTRQPLGRNDSHPIINFLLSRNGERFILVSSTFIITNLVWLGLYNSEKQVASDASSTSSSVAEISQPASVVSNPSALTPVPQAVQATPISTPSPVPEVSSTDSEVDNQSSPSPDPQLGQAAPSPEPGVQSQVSVISQPAPEPVVDTSAEAFLISFLDSITTTANDGTSAWCKSSEILVASFFSPRAYTILSFSERSDSFSASVRIEASNRGGSPVISTWLFLGKKGTAMIPNPSYHGWCVSLIDESS